MSRNEGYIKIHRKMKDWEWYQDPNTFRVFIHLLLSATYKERDFRGHTIKPGQVVCGRKQLAEELGMSESTIRTSINHLKMTNEIAIKTTNKFSIITIENWGKYQCGIYESDQQNNQQADQRLTSKTAKSDHIQEYKNIKEYKNIYSAECVEIINYLNGRCGTSYKPFTKDTVELIGNLLDDGFTVDDFKQVIDKKSRQWLNDNRMCKFLRPKTLFSGKFEGYLNEHAPASLSERWDTA